MGASQNVLWYSEGNSSQISVWFRFRNCPVCGSPRWVASASPSAWGWVPSPCPRPGSPPMWWSQHSLAALPNTAPPCTRAGSSSLFSHLQNSSDSSNSGWTLISIGFGFIWISLSFLFHLTPLSHGLGKESVGLESTWTELASLRPGLWALLSYTRGEPWEEQRRMQHAGSWNLWSVSPSTISQGSFEKSDIHPIQCFLWSPLKSLCNSVGHIQMKSCRAFHES